MAEKFDELAKSLAAEEDLPRRRMLGRVAAAMGGGLAALFASERSAVAAPPVKCPPGLTNCDGLCRDIAVNADHCGTCGNACAAGQMCRSGVCVDCTCAQPCPAGQTRCGNVCVNLQTDPTHCGSCTTVCGSGQVCVNGQCATGCPPGFTSCGGACVDLNSDLAHCGACNRPCVSRGCENVTCRAGSCTREPVDARCDDGNPCTNSMCIAETGTCSHVPLANGTDCPGGTCQNGTCVPSGGGAANGQPCSGPSQCASGFCVNGVCCNQSCSGVCATCASGTCMPQSAQTMCRPAAGPCDVAELCDGVSLDCPPDAMASPGTQCGPNRFCDGTSVICPPAP